MDNIAKIMGYLEELPSKIAKLGQEMVDASTNYELEKEQYKYREALACLKIRATKDGVKVTEKLIENLVDGDEALFQDRMKLITLKGVWDKKKVQYSSLIEKLNAVKKQFDSIKQERGL